MTKQSPIHLLERQYIPLGEKMEKGHNIIIYIISIVSSIYLFSGTFPQSNVFDIIAVVIHYILAQEAI